MRKRARGRRTAVMLMAGIAFLASAILLARWHYEDGMRSREEKISMMRFPNPWTVVPLIEEVPELDDCFLDRSWEQAGQLGDFRTAFRLQSNPDGPEYRISYNAQKLYVAGSIALSELETLSVIEFLFMPDDGIGRTYYTLSIPVRSQTQLNGTYWSEPEDAVRVSLPAEGYRICRGKERVTLKAEIPFGAMSRTTPADGEEWRANIMHIPEPSTGPLLSWAPLRQHYYTMGGLTLGGKQSLEAKALIREGRMGSLYFASNAFPSPHRVEDWELEWKGYTEKQLSFPLPEKGLNPETVRLLWQPPEGDWTEAGLEGWTIDEKRRRLTLTFSHPEAKMEGLYRLQLKTTSEGGQPTLLTLFLFDRDWLIERGETAYSQKADQSRRAQTSRPVSREGAMREKSAEVLRIMSLIPAQSGFQVVGDPHQPERKPIRELFKLSEDGSRLVNDRDGEAFPNEAFPETNSVLVRDGQGEPQVYPYYEDEEGRRYFFTAKLWFEQRLRAIELTTALARTDPLGTADVLLDFANKASSYVPIANWEWNVQPLHADAVPVERSGLWSPWHVVDLIRGLTELLQAFQAADRTEAFELLSDEHGFDVRQRIMERLFLPSVEFVLQFPIKQGNTDPYVWQGLIEIGRVLGKPDYVHRAVEWMETFLETEFLADGMWKEVTLSYHSQVVSNIRQAMRGLEGYSDPPGYLSPRTGRRFDRLQPDKYFANLRKAQEIASRLTYPDGKRLPIQDTWANAAGPAPVQSEPLLLSSIGVGRLAAGTGTLATQLYVLFSPKYGHNHYDPLHLSLFAQGQELLPDLGYSSSKYRRYSISTLGHNTVLVDSADMKAERASVHGGQAERFVAVADSLQWQRIHQHDAYPQTKEYSREAWWIPFPGQAASEGYAVDLFRVAGGGRHEYVLQGDANRAAVFHSESAADFYGTTMLPQGVQAREAENQQDFGDAEGHYPGYMYVKDVWNSSLPDSGSFRVELKTSEVSDGRPGAGLSIIGLLEPGDNTLFLGRAPSLRSTRLHGKARDTNEEGDRYDLPKLVLRREGNELRSDFATLLEPYRAGGEGRIESAERLPLRAAAPGAVALKIIYGDVIDLVLSNPGNARQTLETEGVSLDGEMGFVRWRGGQLAEMMLIGGERLQAEGHQLDGEGILSGTVTGTLRLEEGEEVNALAVDAPVTEEAAGRYVIVTHPDGRSRGYLIQGVRREEGGSWLLLGDQDPGFVLGADGSSREVFYPLARWDGAHVFSIADIKQWSDVSDDGRHAAAPAAHSPTMAGSVYGGGSFTAASSR